MSFQILACLAAWCVVLRCALTIQALAVDVSLAALLGENIYNFGELLLHPIVSIAHKACTRTYTLQVQCCPFLPWSQ